MADAWHLWGSDLVIDSKGDICLVDGAALGQQRILRRLMTNPGDYIWEPNYGAGLGAFVGVPVSESAIASVVRTQMFMERSVSYTPAPQIMVDVPLNDRGSVFVQIQYTDADQGGTQVLRFSLPGNAI